MGLTIFSNRTSNEDHDVPISYATGRVQASLPNTGAIHAYFFNLVTMTMAMMLRRCYHVHTGCICSHGSKCHNSPFFAKEQRMDL